jgi:2-dehydro-3-deoxygluconokinase
LASPVDLLSYGEFMLELRGNSSEISLGGDSLNALTAAGYLGLRCNLQTSIGSDEHQQKILDLLSPLPLQVTSLKAPGKNGKYTISTDSNGERSFDYDRKNSAASHLPEVIGDIEMDCRCLFLSGIAQALTPKWESLVKNLLRMTRQQKILTAFDINYRKKLWTETEASRALHEILPFIDILFMSDEDLPILSAATSNAPLENLFSLGIKVIVHRKGAKGAGYLTKDENLKVFTPPQVKPIDTSGCGDIFSGVFLSLYLQEKNLAECTQQAVNLASMHSEFSGALPHKILFSGAQ